MSTHVEVVAQVRPSAVSLIGSAATASERAGEGAAEWLESFLEGAPAGHRLALVDALFVAAQSLAEALDEIVPGAVVPVPSDLPAGHGMSDDAVAGVRDALAMLTSGGASIERREWVGYASGAVSDERYAAACLALVGRSVDLVDTFAQLTGSPVRKVWSTVRPPLLA